MATVIISGTLHKKGSGISKGIGFPRRNWSKRFVVLDRPVASDPTTHSLRWYDDEDAYRSAAAAKNEIRFSQKDAKYSVSCVRLKGHEGKAAFEVAPAKPDDGDGDGDDAAAAVAAAKTETLAGRAAARMPEASPALAALESSLPPATLAQYMQLFKDYDLDGSGLIDFQEFRLCCRAAAPVGGEPPDDETVTSLFAAADTDGSGQLCWEEFLTAISPMSSSSSSSSVESPPISFAAAATGGRSATSLKALLSPFKSRGDPNAARLFWAQDDEERARWVNAIEGAISAARPVATVLERRTESMTKDKATLQTEQRELRDKRPDVKLGGAGDGAIDEAARHRGASGAAHQHHVPVAERQTSEQAALPTVGEDSEGGRAEESEGGGGEEPIAEAAGLLRESPKAAAAETPTLTSELGAGDGAVEEAARHRLASGKPELTNNEVPTAEAAADAAAPPSPVSTITSSSSSSSSGLIVPSSPARLPMSTLGSSPPPRRMAQRREAGGGGIADAPALIPQSINPPPLFANKPLVSTPQKISAATFSSSPGAQTSFGSPVRFDPSPPPSVPLPPSPQAVVIALPQAPPNRLVAAAAVVQVAKSMTPKRLVKASVSAGPSPLPAILSRAPSDLPVSSSSIPLSFAAASSSMSPSKVDSSTGSGVPLRPASDFPPPPPPAVAVPSFSTALNTSVASSFALDADSSVLAATERLREEKSELQKQLFMVIEFNDSLNSSLERLDKERMNEIELLKTHIQLLNAEIGTYKMKKSDDLKNLDRINEELNESLTEMREEVISAKEREGAIKTKFERTQERLKAAEETILKEADDKKQLQGQISLLLEVKDVLESELEASSARVQLAWSSPVKKRSSKKPFADEEREQHIREKKELEAAIKRLTADFEKSEKKNEELKKRLAREQDPEAQLQLEKAQSENKKITTKLIDLENKVKLYTSIDNDCASSVFSGDDHSALDSSFTSPQTPLSSSRRERGEADSRREAGLIDQEELEAIRREAKRWQQAAIAAANVAIDAAALEDRSYFDSNKSVDVDTIIERIAALEAFKKEEAGSSPSMSEKLHAAETKSKEVEAELVAKRMELEEFRASSVAPAATQSLDMSDRHEDEETIKALQSKIALMKDSESRLSDEHLKIVSEAGRQSEEIDSLNSRLALAESTTETFAALLKSAEESKNNIDSSAESEAQSALIAEHRLALANAAEEKNAEVMRFTALLEESNQQISILDLKVLSLISKNSDDLDRHREESDKHISTLERSNDSMRISLEQASQKQESLEKQLRASKNELDAFRAQVEERMLASQRDASLLAEERDHVIGKLKSEVGQLKGALQDDRTKFEESSEAHKAELKNAESKQKRELKEEKDKYDLICSERDALEVKVNAMRLLCSERDALEVKFNVANSEKNDAVAEKERVENTLKQANESLSLAELEKANTQKERDLEKSTLKREIHAGAERVRVLESELHSKTCQLRQAAIEAQDAQSTVKTLKEQLRCIETDMSLRINELERSELGSSRKVAELERDVLSLRGQCDGLINKQLSLGEDLSAKETTISDLKSKLVDKQSALERSESESEGKIAALQKEFDKANALKAASEKREKALKADAEVITGEMIEMQKRIDTLAQQLASKDEYIKSEILVELEDAKTQKRKMKEWQGIRDAQADEDMVLAKKKILELEHRVRLKEGEVNGLKIELRRRGGGTGSNLSSSGIISGAAGKRADDYAATPHVTNGSSAAVGDFDDSDDDSSTPMYGIATDTPLRMSELGSTSTVSKESLRQTREGSKNDGNYRTSRTASPNRVWIPASHIPWKTGDRSLSPSRRVPSKAEVDIASTLRQEIGALKNASRK